MKPVGSRRAWRFMKTFWLSALVVFNLLLSSLPTLTVATAASPQSDQNGLTQPTAAVRPGVRPRVLDYNALKFDSFDTFFRTPFGAVPFTSTVTLRFQTGTGQASQVQARLYDTVLKAENYVNLTKFANDGTYDYWQYTIPAQSSARIIYYKFKVTGTGGDVAWYQEQKPSLGGLGQASNDFNPDYSYHITYYGANFQTPDWMKNAVLYQIFPDRFVNGDPTNDSKGMSSVYTTTGVTNVTVHANWSDLPDEPPMGTDFSGGDLKGIDQKINAGYFNSLGVTALYLNPIFFAPSNHKYDTADYLAIDPRFGTMADFDQLIGDAHAHGLKVILDGVFNHTSSDSYYFNRYGHFNSNAPFDPNNPMAVYTSTSAYNDRGAYHDQNSPFYWWYQFTNWPNYNGWFGFDSLPKLWSDQSSQHQSPAASLASYIYSSTTSVATSYINVHNIDGWRLDVADNINDPNGPDANHAFLAAFRNAVKAANPLAVIISEIWYDTSPWFLGDQMDSTMNYRFRNAVDGFLANGYDNDQKEPGYSGIETLSASQFGQRMQSIIEDYPPQVYQALMNLVDSHDRIRLRWGLGDCDRAPFNTQDTQHCSPSTDPATIDARQKLVAVQQYGMPGAPQIYYGDEVGVTGYADPDDRRTYPTTLDSHAQSLLSFYQNLGQVRGANPVLRTGDFVPLLNDDNSGTYAYMRTISNGAQVAIVVLNNQPVTTTLQIPVAGKVPNGTQFNNVVVPGGNNNYLVSQGKLQVPVKPYEGVILLPVGNLPAKPAAPTNLAASGGSPILLTWTAGSGDASYTIYRSLASGGSYTKVGTTINTNFVDTTVYPGVTYYYIVKGQTSTGYEGPASNEVSRTATYQIGYANLQYPPTATQIVSAVPVTNQVNYYGRIYIAGVTDQNCQAVTGLIAQIGYGTTSSDPTSDPSWQWFPMSFNAGHQSSCDNNSEYQGQIFPDRTGTFDYVTRFSTDGGNTYTIGCYNQAAGGNIADPGCNTYGGNTYVHGVLTVTSNPETNNPPAKPIGLYVASQTNSSVTIAWQPNSEADLFQYWVYTSTTANGFDYNAPPAVKLVPTANPTWTNTGLASGSSLYYTVIAVNNAYGKSQPATPVLGTATPRNVTVTFVTNVPTWTPVTDNIFLVGDHFCNWCGPQAGNPQAVTMTRQSAYVLTKVVTFTEGTAIQYKYTRGDWTMVEKNADGSEANNRTLTVGYGTSGSITVTDTVANWRDALIQTQPQNQLITSGQSATLSVVVTGTPGFTYQWYKGASGNSSQLIAGATNATYNTGPLTTTTTYWVQVNNEANLPKNSTTATITVQSGNSCPGYGYVVSVALDSGDGQTCGTLSNALLRTSLDSSRPLTITFYPLALNGYVITMTATTVTPTLTVPAGVTISGDGLPFNNNCSAVPAITINGNGKPGDGLTLTGNASLRNLLIKGFNGRPLVLLNTAHAGPNRLKCVVVRR